jgi:chromosome partitioning protein
MSIPVIAFFNNKAGVGKTSLVYHLAWMYSDLGTRVLAADLDPQSNLTAACLGDDEDQLQTLWEDDEHHATIYGCIQPLVRGTGDIVIPNPQLVSEYLALLPGDLLLSAFEDELSSQWPEALSRNERAFRVLSAFWRIMQGAAENHKAELILVDLGPNLGSINRAGLIAADHVVVPLSPDLFSLQGLRNLGPTFAKWREEWSDRLNRKPKMDIELPGGRMAPLGYIVLQHSVRLDRPVKAYDKWINRIPGDYRKYVLSEPTPKSIAIQDDPHKLALLKHYRSLMPMAQEAHKPMFHLKPADGAIGAHFQSAQEVRRDFAALARVISAKANLTALSLP